MTERKKEMIKWLYNNLYDPWTEEITYSDIEKDIEENPENIIEWLIERYKELERDTEDGEDDDDNAPETYYGRVEFNGEYKLVMGEEYDYVKAVNCLLNDWKTNKKQLKEDYLLNITNERIIVENEDGKIVYEFSKGDE